MRGAVRERSSRGGLRAGLTTAGPKAAGPLGVVLLTAMIAAQVASGLRPDPIRLTSVVVVLLAASALAFAARTYGLRTAVAAFAASVAAGYAAEWVGVRTGLPFGDYDYTGVLWPQLGEVPVIVALAWGGMGLAAHATASAVTGGGRGTPAAPRARGNPGDRGPAAGRVARITLGACALTAWDLFLDPQMTRLNLWTWSDPGPYRGIPVSNFVGWLLVSLLVMALIDVIVAGRAARSAGLVSIYTVMAFMETLGFAAVFDPPDPLVATAGGICMGLFAALAWAGMGRRGWRK